MGSADDVQEANNLLDTPRLEHPSGGEDQMRNRELVQAAAEARSALQEPPAAFPVALLARRAQRPALPSIAQQFVLRMAAAHLHPLTPACSQAPTEQR